LIPLNQRDGVRQSSALTHLAAARDRPNLDIRCGVTIDRLEIVGGSPRAVILADGGRVEADLVIVAAGVYGSPAILMRSGLGPADELRALGIEPVADLPAVGENLRDHPLAMLPFQGDLTAIGELEPPMQSLLTFASDGSGDPDHTDIDILVSTIGAAVDSFGVPRGTVLGLVGLMKPRSVGRVRLSSADPNAAPRIWLNYFDDPSDLERMIIGVEAMRDVFSAPALQRFIGTELAPGPDVHGAELGTFLRATTPSYAHGAGTCQMGTDPGTSVVDQAGRVHGVENLWVIDASIMPAIPSVPTNFATMMLAERCVDWLREA
jgi:choline dehydrogenase